jgi:hypothetical protein
VVVERNAYGRQRESCETIVRQGSVLGATFDPSSPTGFAQVARVMVGLQRRGIESSIDLVPVHPGLARYIRERGAWDSKRDGRVATPQSG